MAFYQDNEHTRRKNKARSLTIDTGKVDIKKSIKELLQDKSMYELVAQYGKQAGSYEELISFFTGLVLILINQAFENIQRLQEVEPKTAELNLELINAINQTINQANSFIKSISHAYKQFAFMNFLLSDFLTHQINAVYTSGLEEEVKKDIVYRLISQAKDYELKDREMRKQAFEKVILEMFGLEPPIAVQEPKAWDKEKVLDLLRSVYEG